MPPLLLKGRKLPIDGPLVMGILNVTPDSFYDGGTLQTRQATTDRVGQMLADGATIIDIGGQSSRPGATPVSEQEETDRVLSGIEAALAASDEVVISVDTFQSAVAERAIDAGAHIINDISGGNLDPDMFGTAARLEVPYILMHMQGTPATMQQAPSYSNVVQEVVSSLSERVAQLRLAGVQQIIVDPGFGFGKSVAHNYALLNALDAFHSLKVPLLVGFSRKSMINRVLGTTPAEALNGTTVLNTIALMKGAHILRVHDVREAAEAVSLVKALLLPT